MIRHSHGGAVVSDHLHRELQGLFESVDKSQVPGVNGWVKSLGGYFKRYQGGVLRKWDSDKLPSSPPLDLESRATLAFLQVCTTCPLAVGICDDIIYPGG
jgi:protein phosphatase PTC6